MDSLSVTDDKKHKKEKKGGIDKSQIGKPMNFRHEQYIGFDPEKGFIATQNISPEWQEVFKKAGITPEILAEKPSKLSTLPLPPRPQSPQSPPPPTKKPITPPPPPTRKPITPPTPPTRKPITPPTPPTRKPIPPTPPIRKPIPPTPPIRKPIPPTPPIRKPIPPPPPKKLVIKSSISSPSPPPLPPISKKPVIKSSVHPPPGKLEKEFLEKLEKERLEKEKQEKETFEKERLEIERLEIERQERERQERERQERERLERERLESEKEEYINIIKSLIINDNINYRNSDNIYFEWEIEDWNICQSFMVNIYSPVFYAHGHKWKLMMVPNSTNEYNEDCVDLGLICDDINGEKIIANFVISIRNYKNYRTFYSQVYGVPINFDYGSPNRGFGDFIGKSELIERNSVNVSVLEESKIVFIPENSSLVEDNKIVVGVYITFYENSYYF